MIQIYVGNVKAGESQLPLQRADERRILVEETDELSYPSQNIPRILLRQRANCNEYRVIAKTPGECREIIDSVIGDTTEEEFYWMWV